MSPRGNLEAATTSHIKFGPSRVLFHHEEHQTIPHHCRGLRHNHHGYGNDQRFNPRLHADILAQQRRLIGAHKKMKKILVTSLIAMLVCIVMVAISASASVQTGSLTGMGSYLPGPMNPSA